jgi:hypothetical protein
MISADLNTPHSRSPQYEPFCSAIEFKDRSISAITTERQQQLDATWHYKI